MKISELKYEIVVTSIIFAKFSYLWLLAVLKSQKMYAWKTIFIEEIITDHGSIFQHSHFIDVIYKLEDHWNNRFEVQEEYIE